MALTGIEIFKQLPKTNCGQCKFPTCLAFAMKLAAKQASLEACPFISEEAKTLLGEASAPPIRLVKIGVGEGVFEVGEETELFRHEKTFYHPPGFALSIEDTLSDEEIDQKVKKVKEAHLERIGQELKVELIAVRNSSKDPKRFKEAIEKIISATKHPLILDSLDPEAIKAGLEVCAANRPLISAANEENCEKMAQLAKENNCPLVVYHSDGLDKLSALVEKVTALGVKDIVLDPGVKTAKEIIESLTQIRRSAVKKTFRPLGFPVMIFTERCTSDSLSEALLAGLGVMKYASIIVLQSVEISKMLPLFALRQNIFTDPQQPLQVEEKIYEIGSVDENSPLLITTNFSLTYFLVRGEIENSRVPARLMIADAEGMSVLTAWAADKFNAPKIAKLVKNSGIADKVKQHKLIIPGYVAVLSGELEEELPGWEIVVGPREAANLPTFLKNQ